MYPSQEINGYNCSHAEQWFSNDSGCLGSMGEKSKTLLDAFDEAIGLDSDPMEWIETLRQLSGKSLRSFAKDCGTDHSQLANLMRRPSTSSNKWMKTLCLMRKESGLTGNQLFKLWEKIYLDDKD